jgi:DNA polymerase I-like protein with 3'-5' exonuclease and polymerase domains
VAKPKSKPAGPWGKGGLWDDVTSANDTDPIKNWVPPDLNTLRVKSAGIKRIRMDFETTGVRWWEGDLPVGAGFDIGDRYVYVPWGHLGGGNIPEERVREWYAREIRDVEIENHTTKFERHMEHNWGIDLEAQGCSYRDVALHAALLDNDRRQFNQDALCEAYLPGERKVTHFNGQPLDMSRVKEYHAAAMAPRAMNDVRQVGLLHDVFDKQIREESLERVRDLEDSNIAVTALMERNGILIDRPKLKRWRAEAEQEEMRVNYNISREVGFKVQPTKNNDMVRVFEKLGLDNPYKTDEGAPSFTDEVLAEFAVHPTIAACRRSINIASKLSKYLRKYDETVGDDCILRYALHQVRSDEGGTGFGRYASSALGKKAGGKPKGCNIQQVVRPDEDENTIEDWVIRELMIAPEGRYFITADAEQIEYRTFAHYAATPKVLAAYEANPRTHFHKLIWSLIGHLVPGLTYKAIKNLNFAKMYGAGLIKLAFMCGFITEQKMMELQSRGLKRWEQKELEELALMVVVDRIYNEQLPEVEPLLRLASHLAQDQCSAYCKNGLRGGEMDENHRRFADDPTGNFGHRGYVQTILGRRARFVNGNRAHKAFNNANQGTAADILKLKQREIYNERKKLDFTMRATVHDELVGDTASKHHAGLLQVALNRQAIQLKVPILWAVKMGLNWAHAVSYEEFAA